MARKRGSGRKNRRGFRSRYVERTTNVTALANTESEVSDLTDNFDRDVYVISGDFAFSLTDLAPGQGPLRVGLCHGVYTQVEVDSWVETTADVGEDNEIAKETRRRKIRNVGTFSGLSEATILNDGKPVHVKLGFVIPEGEALASWIYNRSGATLTDGAELDISGQLHYRLL